MNKMGKSNSKPLTKSDLMGCAKIMCEKHGADSCKQLPLWVKFGFPENGSFSVAQIQKLQEKLVNYEKMKRKSEIDWKAFRMWKSETERRQSRQEKGRKRASERSNHRPQGCSHPQKEVDLIPASAAHQRHQNQQPVDPDQEGQGQLAAAAHTMPGPESALKPSLSTPDMLDPRAVSRRTRSETTHAIEITEVPNPRETGVVVIYDSAAWTPDEMHSIASKLPDITTQGGAAFVEVLSQFVQLYEPSLREIRRLLLHSIGLKCVKVQDVWPGTDMLYDWTAGTGYRGHVERLFERIKATFPATTRWSVIICCKQQPSETVADYLVRLTNVFKENIGMMPPADPQTDSAYEQILKYRFLDGMDEQISCQVRKHCIGWDEERLSVVRKHAVHAEQKLRDSEREREQARARLNERFLEAQLQFLQGLSRRKGRGSRNAVPRGDGCWNCGDPDHWARDCNTPRKKKGLTGPPYYM